MDKSKVIEKLFLYIATYSYLLLPLLFLFYKNKQRESIILVIYGIVFFLLLFFVYDIPPELRSLYNTFFTFLEYSCFTALFYLNINSKQYKKAIIILSALFILFQITHYFFMDNSIMDSIPIGVESILIFIYIFLFFLENMRHAKQQFIYTHPCFWISVALLIYLGGSFFINILANSLNEDVLKYWYFTYIGDIIKTILFGIAFIILGKKSHTKIQTTTVPYLDLI